MGNQSTKFAVLGAGNGGHAMTADLSMMGFYVNLFELPQFEENIKPIQQKGGIHITGFAPGVQEVFPKGWTKTGFAKIQGKVTTDIREAVEDVDVIEIVTPAFGHEAIMNECAPHLRRGQIVVFNTGNWACFRFAHKLREMGIEGVILAEASLLIYSCRRSGPAQVHIDGMKQTLNIAALPAKKTSDVLRVLQKAYPQLKPAKNVLQTSLENLNLVFHPALMIMNAALVEHKKGDFLMYPFGCSPSVAKVISAVDQERLAVAKALDLELDTAMDFAYKSYGAKGKNYYEAIQNIKPFHDPIGGRAPSNMKFRYITEDVPFALVPLASLGDLLGILTPTIKALIHLASIINGIDYVKEGTTVEKLGLAGLNAQQIVELVS